MQPEMNRGRMRARRPSYPPGGLRAAPLTFFMGHLESILISLKPRLLCPQQGHGRDEQMVQGGRIKCEIEMSEIIHFKSPETFIYCVDRTTTFNYLK